MELSSWLNKKPAPQQRNRNVSTVDIGQKRFGRTRRDLIKRRTGSGIFNAQKNTPILKIHKIDQLIFILVNRARIPASSFICGA